MERKSVLFKLHISTDKNSMGVKIIDLKGLLPRGVAKKYASPSFGENLLVCGDK